MFGFGWLKYLPWSRAQRTARARREVEQVVERSSVLARAVEEQVRHQRLLSRQKAEADWQATRKAEALLVADRRAVIAQMQAERRARSGTQLARSSFAPAPATPRRDDSAPAAADTPALTPLHQHWGAAPASSALESSCHSSHDSGGSSDSGSCGGGD